MTNKTEEELTIYSGEKPVVKHLAMPRNACIVLNVDLIRYDEYGKSSTYFTHFWTKTNL